jgi:DNA-directed RNA polymerase subunit RPC12/RpoP
MKCINPACGKEFIPKRAQQRYHDAACHRSAMKRLLAARIAAHRQSKGKP